MSDSGQQAPRHPCFHAPVGIPAGGCLATFEFETGAWAYILTPRGAQMLLEVTSQGDLKWPVDHFINPSTPCDFQSHEERLSDDYLHLERSSVLW